MAGGDLDPAPLRQTEVQQFRSRAIAAGTLSSSAIEQASARLVEVLEAGEVISGREHLPTLVAAWSNDIEEAFAGLEEDRAVDPRFVDCVLLQADKA
jgi:hypothetical protein